MQIDHQEIKKAIVKSQHCQRNWNLEKQIPEEDIDLMLHAVTNCPSKQNHAYYSVYAITDRNIIERIHAETGGFYIVPEKRTVTNSQTLANVLFVFTDNTQNSPRIKNQIDLYGDTTDTIKTSLHTNVGVASGYLNLTATILGYSTGCCQCFDENAVKEILDTKDNVVLMMGVGYKSDVSRRIHHADKDITFPSFKKEEIAVKRL